MAYLETVQRRSQTSEGAQQGGSRRATVVALRPAAREPSGGQLRVALLGPPTVDLAGRPVAFRTRKALALLLYLAVERGPQPRDLLAALLWPESDQRAARTMLRSTLAAVRRGLGESAGGCRLVATTDTVALAPAGVALDLAALERAARAAEAPEPSPPAAGTASRRAALLALLEAAAEAYRGDFLAGFTLPDAPEFDDWASARREEAHRRLGLVLARLAELRAAGGETAAAVAAARRWAAHDPLDEAAHRATMRALAAAGDRAGALAAYARCRAVLGEELGVAPAPETEALAVQLQRAAPCPAAPAGTPPAAPRPRTAATEARRGPLVGRATEFGRLVEHYALAARGQTRVVAVEGEAGIGKTRLAGEFLGWATAQGATVLRGRASQAGGLPYGPLVEALRPALADADLRAALPHATLGELARLWPELREQVPGPPAPAGDPAAGRAGLFEAVARAATTLSGGGAADRRPVVLFLDDLQWADRATLDLLAYALRRWAGAGCPVLALLALRGDEVGATLERWLAGLRREVAMATLELGPLDEAATVELAAALGLEGPAAGGSGAAASGRWLHADTGGQPLFVVETVRALVDRGPRPDTRPGPMPVGPAPPRVRAAIRARLARLGPDAAALVVAAAVLDALGAEVTFVRLAWVAGLDEDAALAALDEALARRLLREVGEAGYAFTNPKVSGVAAAEAGRARRAVFQRRAQAALAAEDGSARGAPAPARLALVDERQAGD